MPVWSKCTHLYVASGKYGLKIGISWRVAGRIYQMTSAREPVTLVGAWERPDAADVEHAVKQALRDRCTFGYEWFGVTEGEMMEAIERASVMVAAGTAPKRPTVAARAREQQAEERMARIREGIAALDRELSNA
jgi:hypothetical protein